VNREPNRMDEPLAAAQASCCGVDLAFGIWGRGWFLEIWLCFAALRTVSQPTQRFRPAYCATSPSETWPILALYGC
jgi:hypothetical protein